VLFNSWPHHSNTLPFLIALVIFGDEDLKLFAQGGLKP
jgi:hypothetical protein